MVPLEDNRKEEDCTGYVEALTWDCSLSQMTVGCTAGKTGFQAYREDIYQQEDYMDWDNKYYLEEEPKGGQHFLFHKKEVYCALGVLDIDYSILDEADSP
jgi:hypothetical protein